MFLKIINSKIQLKGSSAMNLTKDREKNEKLCYFISINGVHCALRIHDFSNIYPNYIFGWHISAARLDH